MPTVLQPQIIRGKRWPMQSQSLGPHGQRERTIRGSGAEPLVRGEAPVKPNAFCIIKPWGVGHFHFVLKSVFFYKRNISSDVWGSWCPGSTNEERKYGRGRYMARNARNRGRMQGWNSLLTCYEIWGSLKAPQRHLAQRPAPTAQQFYTNIGTPAGCLSRHYKAVKTLLITC